MRLSARLAAATALVALAWSSPTAADLDGNSFTSATWRVRMTAPKGWQLSERSSYPSVLLWMSRRAPRGKIIFSAEELRAGETAKSYADRTVKQLQTLGFRVRASQLHSSTGAYWTEFETDTAFLREAFLVSGAIGYSLTMSSDSAHDRNQHLRAFDSTLRSITVLPPASPGSPPVGAEAPPPVAPPPPAEPVGD